MRKPTQVEHLYLDFDGFFASVEQLRDPSLRGRPVGIIPYEGGRTCIIACSREAKALGVKNVMDVAEARKLCRDLVLVSQKPDLYRRAHHALISEIASVIPVDQVKSIDELACRLSPEQRNDPASLGANIKRTLRYNIGATITCSIGFAANRHLAKIACATQKPDGQTIWSPDLMRSQLERIPMEDIPGVGHAMLRRLGRAGILSTPQLLATQPKQLRVLWRNVTGERLWYVLHGYAVEAPKQERGMFGHARVLPPDQRRLSDAREIARLLLIKATRRVRREGYYASALMLWLQGYEQSWGESISLPQVNDYQAVLRALTVLWARVTALIPPHTNILRVGATLGDLTPSDQRQLDLFLQDDLERKKWEAIGDALDALNAKYGRTVASIGPWSPPKGGNVGGKISYTRIPSGEDFW